MLAHEGECIGKGRQGFAIPSRLSNRKRVAIQQLMSKDGNARKECQQGRSRAQNRQIGPLALRLDAQMSTNLMKGDFNCPAQDKPLHDLESLCILIGAEPRHGLILSLWITNEDPTDRDRRDGRLIPQRRASRDLHLSGGSPIPGQRVCLPLRRRISEARSELGLRFAFEGMATSFSGFTHWGRIVQTRIQAQARNDAHQRQAADFQQELQHRIRPISNHHQTSTRHPARNLQEHLPGPIGDGFMAHLALLMVAFRGSQHAQKGQRPDTASPWDGRKPQQRNPTQPIGFHKKLLARANRITIDTPCGNVAASSALDGFIDAQDHWLVSGNKQMNQQPQQSATELSTRPGGTIEHAMIVLELLIVRASHHSQDGGNGSLSGSQDRSDHEHLGPFPHSFAQGRLKMAQHRYNPFWQSQHLFFFPLAEILREAYSAFRFLSTDWIKSTLYSRKKGMLELSISIMKSRKPGALGGVSIKPMCFISRIPSGLELCTMMMPRFARSRSMLLAPSISLSPYRRFWLRFNPDLTPSPCHRCLLVSVVRR